MMNVRSMRPDELDATLGVWREANIARGAPRGPERTARSRTKLSASDALPFVALRPGIVGMALAEPGRLDDGAGELDPLLLRMALSGKTAPLLASVQIQYVSLLDGGQPSQA